MPLAVQEIVWTIVVAGGTGARFGRLKQYEDLGGVRMIDRSAHAAAAVGGVVVVVPVDDVVVESSVFATVVAGGATRSASVRAGLAAVPVEATVICVHDAARPFATDDLFARVIEAVRNGADGAVPGLGVVDTIKVVDADGRIIETPNRATLVAVQTPQAFRAEVLRNAHSAGVEGTDDAALVERLGLRVVVVAGEADNRKITHPADLDWARARVGP